MNRDRFEAAKSDILSMIQSALTAVDPYQSTFKHLVKDGDTLHVAGESIDLNGINHLYLIAIGKAAVPMAQAAVDLLDDHLTQGIAVTKHGQTGGVDHSQMLTLYAAHPVPDERSVYAADAVIELLSNTAKGDFVLFLISGGASALCTRPLLPLIEWQTLSNELLASGCTIQEFNTVRKQLDAVKGGGLGHLALPARMATLVLSDVIGNPIGLIGSGPTVPSNQTAHDALAVLEQYHIVQPNATDLLASLVVNEAPSDFFSLYQITGDINLAAKAAQKQAEQCGYRSKLLTTSLQGEARDVGRWAADIGRDLDHGICAIAGGETTVTLHGKGIGGRNQELALAAAIAIAGAEDVVVATFATDGDDGPTSAAGAIVHGRTVELGQQAGLSAQAFLENNDSYTFFDQIEGSLLVTGQTGTNVNDLLFVIKFPVNLA